ncbi:MAG TPA: hypothetical protein VN601_08100 [Arthrobacter sp.]|nr:hypothetical protein [Arthrobacter sp.]
MTRLLAGRGLSPRLLLVPAGPRGWWLLARLCPRRLLSGRSRLSPHRLLAPGRLLTPGRLARLSRRCRLAPARLPGGILLARALRTGLVALPGRFGSAVVGTGAAGPLPLRIPAVMPGVVGPVAHRVPSF